MFANRVAGYLGMIVVAAICGCEHEGISLPGNDGPTLVGVTWENPLPQGNDLRRLWGFSDGSFYAVGDAGTVLHFDNLGVSMKNTPTRSDLQGVWADTPSDVFAVGFNGTLIHYDGTSWARLDTPTNADFYAIWASSASDIFLAAGDGSVWNLHGGTWTEYTVASGRRFRALWGYSHNEVYVAGSNSSLFKFDGTSWTKIVIGTNPQATLEIRDLWGPSPGTFAFVSGSSLAWYDGSVWRAENVIATNVYGQWGFTFDDQVTVSAGLSTHWVSGVQSWYPTTTPEPLFDIWGRATNDYYAVGRYGNMAHFDGSAWASLNLGSFSNLADISVTPLASLAVGNDGSILRRAGNGWLAEHVSSEYQLSGVWSSDDGVSVAVGRYAPNGVEWRQALLTNTGAGWTDIGPIGLSSRLLDVWGSSKNDVYAVGWSGEVLHSDGNSWSVVSEDSQQVAVLRCVNGTSESNVFAVGRTNDLHGFVMHLDSGTWHNTVIPGAEDLYGVCALSSTDAFAVGSLGTIFRLQDATWAQMSSGTTDALFCVSVASATDAYAAGWQGTLLHYDGHSWRKLLLATNRNLSSLSHDDSGSIVLVGDRGAILRYNTTMVASVHDPFGLSPIAP